MSQAFTDDCFGPDHSAQTDMQNIEDSMAALKSSFSGTTTPANTVAWLSIWDFANNKPVLTNILVGDIPAAMKDAAVAVASLRTLGTGAAQAAPGNDSRFGVVNDAGVSQAKLKTATGSSSVFISTALQSGWTGILPGGEYGFFPQTKYATASFGYMYIGMSNAALSTSYQALMGYFNTAVADNATGYIQQRYVQSSGEIHWLFYLKNRETGLIEKAWQCPDHPCFGNGDDPEFYQHPFGNYDQDKYELIVINPPKDLVKSLRVQAGKRGEILEVLSNNYRIDDLSSPPWPQQEVTVGLPGDWEDAYHTGKPVKPIKSIVPKPKQALSRVLKKI